MESTNKSNFSNAIDNLVSDYLSRKPSGSGHRHPKPSSLSRDDRAWSPYTLEEVCQYFERSHPDFCQPRNDSIKEEDKLTSKLTKTAFPNEVTWYLLRFFPFKTLLSLRLVSRNWNELSSEHARNVSHSPISLRITGEFLQFLDIVESRIGGIPYACYRVEYSPICIISDLILKELGVYMTNLFLNNERSGSGSTLSTILKLIPNVKCLHIVGDLDVESMNASAWPSGLRSLSISVGAGSSLESIQQLIQHSNLRDFELKSALLLNCKAKFINFLQSLNFLRSITLTVRLEEDSSVNARQRDSIDLCNQMPGLKLIVPNENEEEVQGRLNSEWLEYLSEYLKMLQLGACPPLSVNMSHVEELHLKLKSLSSGHLKTSNFPALKKVTVCCYASSREGPHLHDAVFPLVDTLYLKNCEIYFGDEPVTFNKIFPHVQNLRINGNLMSKDQRFVTSFPHLKHLTITTSKERAMPFLVYQEPWELEPLSKLKILEVILAEGVPAGLLLRFGFLTKWKKIQPLELLGFYQANGFHNDPGLSIFLKAGWHKEVVFKKRYESNMW